MQPVLRRSSSLRPQASNRLQMNGADLLAVTQHVKKEALRRFGGVPRDTDAPKLHHTQLLHLVGNSLLITGSN